MAVLARRPFRPTSRASRALSQCGHNLGRKEPLVRSWLLFLLEYDRSSGPRANRFPAKISNFKLFARTEITRIRFFQTVHLCSSVFKNRLADCFTPKPPKVGGELSTRIDLFVHCCPEGIVRLFSQDLVLFSRTHSSICHWAPLTFLLKSPKGPLF